MHCDALQLKKGVLYQKQNFQFKHFTESTMWNIIYCGDHKQNKLN